MTTRLSESIKSTEGAMLVGSMSQRLPNTISFVVEGADSFGLLAALDVEGICASAGAACSAGSLEPSHVVSALGLNRDWARSLVRFSLGRENSWSEVEQAAGLLPHLIRRIRSSQ
jgi:cysteine desulfurase